MLHLLKNNISKVLIDDGCNNDDIKKLSQILEMESKVEISFISTDNITDEVIKLLVKYNKKIKLTTDSKTLWLYLKQFSIPILNAGFWHKTIVEENSIKVIAIGGSAGALNNIVKIIQELPYSDISIFIVIHILPNAPSKLVKIFQQCTNYIVKEAVDGEKVELNTIYIAPPDLHISVKNSYIYTLKTPLVNYSRPSIDVLFKSLAKEYKNSLLAILTCGYLNDGSSSLIDIKENRGLVLIQNPNECEANEIPLHGIITKNYTQVLNIKQINEYIKIRLNSIVDLNERTKQFLESIYTIYDYDFRDYDMHSIQRRVNLLQAELGIKNLIEFEDLVLKDRDVFELLFKKISINVSNFFRNPEVFKKLRNDILPILATYPQIRIWCSACANGQEAYSVAILLDELNLLDRSIIYATDFNSSVLHEAKNALYSKANYQEYKDNYLKSDGKKKFDNWFNIDDNYIEVAKHIKEKVHFFQHNLVTDSEINEFQLVFCRNVLIYFEDNLQKRVFKLVHNSLIPNGFLVLGKSETANKSDGFIQLDESSKYKIFKRV